MDRRRPSRRSDSGADVDLGFGDLFRGIGNLLDLVTELSQQEGTEIRREGKIGGVGRVRGVYGFTIKTGLGGAPTVESFGNVRPGAQGAVVEDVREPIVDVFDEEDRMLVVAELPGVQDSTIKVEVEGDVLSLTAEGKERRYAKELVLPRAVEPTPTKKSYQNGILELEFRRATG